LEKTILIFLFFFKMRSVADTAPIPKITKITIKTIIPTDLSFVVRKI